MKSEKNFISDAASYTGRFFNAAANLAGSRDALLGVASSFAVLAMSVGALLEITDSANRIVEMNVAGAPQAGQNKDLGQEFAPVRMQNGTVVHISGRGLPTLKA